MCVHVCVCAHMCVQTSDYDPEGPVPQGEHAMALFSEGGSDDMTRGQSASRLYGPQRVSEVLEVR